MGWSSQDWLGCPAIAGAAAASASTVPSAKLSVVLRIIRDSPLPLGCFAEPQEMRRHAEDEQDSVEPTIRARAPSGSRSDTPVSELLTSRDVGEIRAAYEFVIA